MGDWRATVRLRHWRKRLTFKAVKIEKLSNRQNWRKTNLAKTDRNGLDPSRWCLVCQVATARLRKENSWEGVLIPMIMSWKHVSNILPLPINTGSWNEGEGARKTLGLLPPTPPPLILNICFDSNPRIWSGIYTWPHLITPWHHSINITEPNPSVKHVLGP